jgi:predicted CXXCH cytochrome family protein
MRTWLKLTVAALAVVGASVVLAPIEWAAADLATNVNNPHHFINTGTSPFNAAPGLCVTCHIPHHAGTVKPLWNHTLSGNTLTFGTNQTTIAGTALPTNIGTWQGTTRLCLSCHDGSIAVGDLINGAQWGTDLITDNAKVVAPSGDLEGNHPVAVPYPATASAVYNGITSSAVTTDYNASPANVKIYQGAVGEQTGVECASCHDPHDYSLGPSEPFLRVAEATLCTSCHIK